MLSLTTGLSDTELRENIFLNPYKYYPQYSLKIQVVCIEGRLDLYGLPG